MTSTYFYPDLLSLKTV